MCYMFNEYYVSEFIFTIFFVNLAHTPFSKLVSLQLLQHLAAKNSYLLFAPIFKGNSL